MSVGHSALVAERLDDVEIYGGGLQALVAALLLGVADIHAIFKQSRGVGVSQGLTTHMLGDASTLDGAGKHLLHVPENGTFRSLRRLPSRMWILPGLVKVQVMHCSAGLVQSTNTISLLFGSR